MYEITAYACSFCKKYYKTKATTRKHEKRCFRNPETKSCITCSKDYNCPLQSEKWRTQCNSWKSMQNAIYDDDLGV